MTVVLVPSPLRSYVGGKREIVVSADTVAEALAALTAESPPMRQHLFAADGTLRGFVNVYVNDDDIRALHGLATQLRDGDTLLIVPMIAGG